MQDKIVHDQISSETSSRTVRLSEVYGNNTVRELYAFMRGHGGVQLNKVTDDEKPRAFRLSTDEMDTLAAQWMQFREDCIFAKETEEKRLAELKAEAFKIAELQPALCIEEKISDYDEQLSWKIHIEEIHLREEAYSLDQLLQEVAKARDAYQAHLDTIAQAQELARTNNIVIKQQDHPGTAQKTWRVTIPSFNWQHKWRADNARELLEYVQDALEYLRLHKQELTTN